MVRDTLTDITARRHYMEVPAPRYGDVMRASCGRSIRADGETLGNPARLAADIMDRRLPGRRLQRPAGLADLIGQETENQNSHSGRPTDCVALGTSIKLRR